LLLTGRAGCGKTTLLKSLLDRFPNRFGGFYTEEVRAYGERIGFTITTVDRTRSALFASVSFSKSKFRVSKYGVDVAGFERIAVGEIRSAIAEDKPLAIDEIGKMELFSGEFRTLLEEVFSSSLPVIATVHAHSHPFTDALKKRSDVELITLDRSSFDAVLRRLTDTVADRIFNQKESR